MVGKSRANNARFIELLAESLTELGQPSIERRTRACYDGDVTAHFLVLSDIEPMEFLKSAAMKRDSGEGGGRVHGCE